MRSSILFTSTLFLATSLHSAMGAAVVRHDSRHAHTWTRDAATRRTKVISNSGVLEVANANISPDGFSRSAVLVNGVYPSPLITGKMGSKFSLTVNDKLTDSTMERTTSIHWHGLFQSGSNYNDGVSMVTQCPLVPGSSYVYNFDVPGQAGTFWYHSHVSTQYCDGLRGPLVIYDDNDPYKRFYDVDDETTVITLSDWYHESAAALAGTFPAQDATLINGLGRYSGGPESALAVVDVTKGKRYRMRLVAAVCHPYYAFSIDQHSFTVIEADGNNVEPVKADQITIHPGQRYSFILHANQAVGNYWIRAVPSIGDATTDGGLNTAILRYAGAKCAYPTFSIPIVSVEPLLETSLHPLEDPAAPGFPHEGGADVNINLDINFNGTDLSMNNVSFVSPSVPVLLQILSGAQSAQSLLPSGSVYTLPKNKVVEVTFPVLSVAGAPHPIHLHGHAFSVVRSAGSSVYNYRNPVRRDVVSIGGTTLGVDNVTIRFETNNAGPWFLHCHIDWHLAAGMAVVFAEDTADTASHTRVSKAWKDLCPSYNKFEASS